MTKDYLARSKASKVWSNRVLPEAKSIGRNEIQFLIAAVKHLVRN